MIFFVFFPYVWFSSDISSVLSVSLCLRRIRRLRQGVEVNLRQEINQSRTKGAPNGRVKRKLEVLTVFFMHFLPRSMYVNGAQGKGYALLIINPVINCTFRHRQALECSCLFSFRML
uniref:Putative secreted protein n=1 Tax=Anopheles darlingi TaxID=43151 RepID=A0A2M4D0V0_ANODA